MKTKRSGFLAVCQIMAVFAGLAPEARADTETLDGVTWGYDVVGGAATVTNAVPASGALAIPAVLGGCPVTGIGPSAFSGCTNVTSVAFPESLANIGSEAFRGCSGVASLTIPDSVADIGGYAFEVCSGLKALSIGEGVERIGTHAFYGCTGLTTVTIPDGTAYIGDRAFYGCTGLKTLTVGNGVTNIAPYAFYQCTALRSLGLGECLATIGDYAFHRCSGLAALAIPDQVESIGDSAFRECTGLKTVVFGSGVTNIGSYAFGGCSGLGSVFLGQNVAGIGTGAFAECGRLSGFSVDADNPSYADDDGVLVTRDMRKLIVFPGGRTGTYAMPDGVTAIGEYAFDGCSGLAGVTIGNSVTNIGAGAFRGCDGLDSVSIPAGVVSIGTAAFAYCHNLAGIRVDEANPAFAGKAGVLFTKNMATLVCCPGGRKGVYSVPPSVTLIRPYAFAGCSGLTTLTIPPSVTRIRQCAFAGCSGLTSMTIPGSVQALEVRSSDLHSTLSWQTVAITKPWLGFLGCSRLQTVYFSTVGMSSRLLRVVRYDGDSTHFGAPACQLVWGNPPAAEGDEAYGAWLSERCEKTPEWLPREGDEDGDGATNWEEYVADTDPTDAAERLEARIRVEDSWVSVEAVPANTGRTYRIYGKKELAAGAWTEVDPASDLVRNGWRFFRAAAVLAEP